MKNRTNLYEDIARELNEQALARMEEPGTRWFLGFYRPTGRQFYVAQRILAQRGVSTYLPLATRRGYRPRHSRRKSRKVYSAIPGGLFFGLEKGEERWYDFFSCQDTVRGVLGLNGQPRAICGRELLEFIHNNHKVFSRPRTPILSVGQRAEIVEGPFAGQIVEIESLNARQKKIVARMFATGLKAELSVDNLTEAA